MLKPVSFHLIGAAILLRPSDILDDIYNVEPSLQTVTCSHADFAIVSHKLFVSVSAFNPRLCVNNKIDFIARLHIRRA